jgi:hypothetical protein
MTAEFSSMLIGMNVPADRRRGDRRQRVGQPPRVLPSCTAPSVLEVRAEADARPAVLNAVDPETSG